MSKRLTDSEKWDDPWFRALSPAMKCVWSFLCDKCDNAGVWKKDFNLLSFYIGADLDGEAIMSVFNKEDKKRLLEVGADKWLVCNFASFQYKNNPKMFNHINSLCQNHGLDIHTLSIGYVCPIDRAKGYHMDRAKVKVKYKYKDKENNVSHFLAHSKGLGRGNSKVVRKKELFTNSLDEQTHLVFDYFCLVTKKKYQLSKERAEIIQKRLKEGRNVEEMKTAIYNFSKDTWEDRHKFIDVIYALGTIKKINNLDKWLSISPKETPMQEAVDSLEDRIRNRRKNESTGNNG